MDFTLLQRSQGDENNINVYGYTPVKSANAIGLALFALAWISHTTLGIYYRQAWFGTCMFIAAGLETAGYIGRVISSTNPMILDDFLVQIICLTLAPAFFMAGIYFLLGEIVVIWGVGNARFKPYTYSKIFISLDIISIVLQAIGGGKAAIALTDGTETDTGTHIMVAGLCFQVFSTLCFAVSCLDIRLRINRHRRHNALYDGPEKFAYIRNSKTTVWFLCAVAVAVLFVFIRSVYRVVELSMGWSGYTMTHEAFFLVLDGLMVCIALFCVLVFYPGKYFGVISIKNEHQAAREPTDKSVPLPQ
ncbi:RTA1 like protein-domain-containing protein [Dipodascopsis uninucleata]